MPMPFGSPFAEAEDAYRRERIMATYRPRSRRPRRLRLPFRRPSPDTSPDTTPPVG